MIIEVTPYIRKLAKSGYYQSLYVCSKEMEGVCLFQNKTDLTVTQLNFLYYLSMYSSLSTDIALGDVDERVLDNEVYEDAYMQYKKHLATKEAKKRMAGNPVQQNDHPMKSVKNSTTQWVFKRGEGKK